MRKRQKCELKKTHIAYLEKLCRNAARLEGNISNKELQQLIYNLGVYAFRSSHQAGFPAEMRMPGLMAPKSVWCKERCAYVDERELVSAKDALETAA